MEVDRCCDKVILWPMPAATDKSYRRASIGSGSFPKGNVSGLWTWRATKPPTRCCFLREQRNVYLSVGSTLLSTAGNALAEIIADTVGRHDTLGGACATESNTVRYALDKKTMHACRDSYLLAVAEHEHFGLNKRDLTHNINFFMNVPVTADGGLNFADGMSGPGKYVELRAAMDIIVLISNCPQLNNPCNAYNPTPLEILIWDPDVS
jgi:urea carboxylase-associated protein 1